MVSVGYTSLYEKDFTYKWIVESFKSNHLLDDSSKTLKSSEFIFNYCKDLKLVGYLTINRISTNDDIYNIEISVKPIETAFKITEIKWKIVFKITLSDMEKKESQPMEYYLYQGYCSFRLQHEITQDNFIILCEIRFADCKLYSKPQLKKLEFEKIESELSKDLEILFENENHWDFILDAAGHEFHVHKCILASRSEIFAAMFRHEMEESKTNRMTITHFNYEIIKEMLRYMYTGKVQNLNKFAFDLLAVCDMYGLENLKYQCGEEILKNLTIESAAETLISADLHRAKELKLCTIDFVNTNAGNVSKTKGWEKLVNEHFHLVTELYLKIIN